MLQIFKFVLVGISNTCLSFAVYSAMMHVLPPLSAMAALSQLLSYSSGMLLSYMLNNFWVFNAKGRASSTVSSFILSQLGMMMLSTLGMAVATHLFRAPAEIIWISVMAFITALNFTILKKWVFKST